MRAVIIRVTSARVKMAGRKPSDIGRGLMVFVGIHLEDTRTDVLWLVNKVAGLRIFADESGKINKSLAEAGGQTMVISELSLHASTKKGNRPSFRAAARPEEAIPLYEAFLQELEKTLDAPVAHSNFGAMLTLEMASDGPATIVLDSQLKE